MLKLLSKSNDNDISHLLDVQGFIKGFFETGITAPRGSPVRLGNCPGEIAI